MSSSVAPSVYQPQPEPDIDERALACRVILQAMIDYNVAAPGTSRFQSAESFMFSQEPEWVAARQNQFDQVVGLGDSIFHRFKRLNLPKGTLRGRKMQDISRILEGISEEAA